MGANIYIGSLMQVSALLILSAVFYDTYAEVCTEYILCIYASIGIVMHVLKLCIFFANYAEMNKK